MTRGPCFAGSHCALFASGLYLATIQRNGPEFLVLFVPFDVSTGSPDVGVVQLDVLSEVQIENLEVTVSQADFLIVTARGEVRRVGISDSL